MATGAVRVEAVWLDAPGHQVWRSSGANTVGYKDPEYVTRYSYGTSRVYMVEFPFLPSFLDSTDFARDTTFHTYGADNKLRAQQAYNEQGMYFLGERRGYFSEYRYDALGRRVLVRTRRDNLCRTAQTSTVDCTSGIERYVWAGDNILWEMRGPGGDTEPLERLEQV